MKFSAVSKITKTFNTEGLGISQFHEYGYRFTMKAVICGIVLISFINKLQQCTCTIEDSEPAAILTMIASLKIDTI